MATATFPRLGQPRERAASRAPTGSWRRVKLLAIVVLGFLLISIPAGVVLGSILSRNAQQEATQLQSDLRQAVLEGVAAEQIRPLQERLARITPQGSLEDPGKAEGQLTALTQLRHDFEALYAAALARERQAFQKVYDGWSSQRKAAEAAGLSLEALADPVARLRGIADGATTPAGVRGVAGVLTTYTSALANRLSAFSAGKTAANALLAQAQATLQSAAQYRELKLDSFRSQLDTAERDIASVDMPEGFSPIQDRVRQIEVAIRSLLSGRQAAYAELAAARSALASARAAGADVSGIAARIENLARQLASAGDAATLNAIAAQLRAERAALNAELIVTIPAPVYQQAMNLDCETSALRVALAYYGHYYTDAQLFAAEPVDARPPVMGSNRSILRWGNPYTHFVGNVNGVAATPTGYGVYYPVIVNLARSHGMPNTVGGEGYGAATIYAELRAHHPVVVWATYNWGSYQGGWWTAWDGTRVRYSYGEHAVTLTGVSATDVRVNDVGHGTQYWISKSTFEASWSVFDKMAVIVK